MRLDLLLDSLYALGSLWGTPSNPQVCPSSLPALSQATAFVGVNVVPMDTERVLTDRTVVVQDGRIVALGPVSRVRVPAGAARVDGRGKYLIPGLSDMHGHHFGVRSLPDGVTAYREIEGNEELFRTLTEKNAPEVRPHRYTSGNVRNFARPGLSLAEVAAAYKAAGFKLIVIPGDLYRDLVWTPERISKLLKRPLPEILEQKLRAHEAFDSLQAVARLANLPMAYHGWPHVLGDEMMLRFSSYNGGSIEHLFPFLTASADLAQGGRDERPDTVPSLHALVAATARAGIWVTPTLACMEALYGLRAERVSGQAVKALHEGGVRLLLGADNGADVHHELAALVRAGLTPYQALETGTRNAAEQMGLLDSSGTVAVGKWADLVLLEGNPLKDISQTIDPAGVLLRGRWLPREELHRIGKRTKADTYWPHVIAVAVRRAGKLAPNSDAMYKPTREPHTLFFAPEAISALADSLTPGGRTRAGHQRVVSRIAARLGESRTRMTPAGQAAFDAEARFWLREYTRQGYAVTISGVQP